MVDSIKGSHFDAILKELEEASEAAKYWENDSDEQIRMQMYHRWKGLRQAIEIVTKHKPGQDDGT